MPPKRSIAAGTSQRQQRRRVVESEDSEEGSGTDADTGAAGDEDDSSTVEIKSQAAQLVRLALFSEYRRQPLRRNVIVKQVLPKSPRSFPAVLDQAQSILRVTFGMELVELRAKGKGDGAIGELAPTQTQTQTQAQNRTQRKGKGRARINNDDDDDDEEEEDEDSDESEQGGRSQRRGPKALGSRTYILCSVLPRELLASMANPVPLPLFDPDDDAYNEANSTDSGALIQWEKGDGTASGNVGLLGIRTVILCLILCLGRVVPDDQLHALLRRIDLTRDTVLPYSSTDSKDLPLTVDKYLDLLARQNYLEKIKIPGPHGTAEGGSISWQWGNRDAEFTEEAAAEFISKIFIDEADSDDDDDNETSRDRRGRPSKDDRATRKVKARRKLYEDLERAAGGPLRGFEFV